MGVVIKVVEDWRGVVRPQVAFIAAATFSSLTVQHLNSSSHSVRYFISSVQIRCWWQKTWRQWRKSRLGLDEAYTMNVAGIDSGVRNVRWPGWVRAGSRCRWPPRPSADPTRPDHVPHTRSGLYRPAAPQKLLIELFKL